MAEYELGDIVRDVYMEMGELRIFTATGGSTTTAEDTKLTGKDIDDETYIGGAILVLLDSAGAGGAPEKEFSVISDNIDDGTDVTFTVQDAFTSAIASGDRIGFTRSTFPLEVVIESINRGLVMLGDFDLVDKTTLDTASSKKEYVQSVVWKRRPPTLIEVAKRTGDSDDHSWEELVDWRVEPSAPGSTGLIVFDGQPLPTGRDLRIWYVNQHPRVNVYSDNINALIHPELATAAAVFKLSQWDLRRSGVDEDNARSWMNASGTSLELALRNFPIRRERKFESKLIIAD